LFMTSGVLLNPRICPKIQSFIGLERELK
jgi:hypothetical protein